MPDVNRTNLTKVRGGVYHTYYVCTRSDHVNWSSHATFPLESKQNCKGKRKNLQEDFLGGISPPTEPKGGSDEPLRGRPPPPGLSGRGKPGSRRFWWIPSYHLQLQLFHHAFSQAKAKNQSMDIADGDKRGTTDTYN